MSVDKLPTVSAPPPPLLGIATADPQVVEAADEAGLDLAVIEDDGELDATLLAARLAVRTRRIGLLPVASTTATEPFLVSVAIATLDFVSQGRAGWVAEVAASREDAAAHVTWEVPADLIGDAREHVEAVRRLWDSWEDGAEIRDAATDRFIDRERLHHINYAGRYLSVRGPSITPRPPQGQPVVAVRDPALGAGADVLLTRDAGRPAPGLLHLVEIDAPGDTVPGAADGLLLRAGDPDAVAALAALRGAAPPPPAATLRERLGLPPAVNRYTKVPAP